MSAIEVWRKSARSGENGSCVELSNHGGIRDSKNPTGPELRLGVAGVRALVKGAQAGRFDS
ncbi:hypothetical protein Lesp02_83840 [Lentzea sp. NBRC 105346]|uniref:DUF397 domain-containing protein n=1 Tax=Lentzea sp. NBRC 105346 TaxID=3032205 RepID=UPI0024A1598B|nr:DUF397 domain-containing protein [Lentzea sp. NBRC 105346]GLZ36197.1 hypothetical protein Lesp02_83840 [Lentzea sp. NBRC 105346]